MQLVVMDGLPIISRRDASEAPLHLAEGPHAGSLRLASTAIAHGEAVLREAAKHAMPRARRHALLVAKRICDIAGASLLLLVAAPFMLLVGLTIRLTDRGPALFGHQRVGRNGVPFRCMKFRSMAVNAEAALAQLLASDSEARAE